jgi:Fusaric acid resistance protein family
MSRLATTWRGLRAWSASHGAELRLCVRSTTAAVLTLAAAQVLHLPIALWAVLTAVILTQISVGRSLKASMDYLVSTLGGAIYAGAIGAFVPHDNSLAVYAALALALAPAVLLAALNARFSAAPFTAVMVFFGPTITHTGPIAAAFERVIEVAVGCVVGLFVSLVVLPARAHDFVIEAATQMLALMARFLPELFAGFTGSLDQQALSEMQNRIGEDLARLDKLAGEAVHERITRLGAEPDQRPLLRTMVRLRHDIIMIGRAALSPLPGAFLPRLRPHLTRISEACADYLHASGAALSGLASGAGARCGRSRARRLCRGVRGAAPRRLDAGIAGRGSGAHFRVRLCARSAATAFARPRPLRRRACARGWRCGCERGRDIVRRAALEERAAGVPRPLLRPSSRRACAYI